MADALPPNIQEFNEIVGVIFAQLYDAHPVDRNVHAEEVASTLGVSPSVTLPSGRSFNVVFEATARWLHEQHYIQTTYGGNPREHIFLTDKALTAMNVVPPALGRSRGSELVDATKEAKTESGRANLAGLVGTLIGSIIKSIIN